MGYDCASRREIEEVLAAGSWPEKIIYAQPCKKPEDIKFADSVGVPLTVVDSVEEVAKLRDAGWSGSALVRLLVADGGSKQPFGKKFGAPLEWLPAIAKEARAGGVKLNGFSFHVGSECQTPEQYFGAIERCRVAADVADKHGFPTEVVDIGGGFIPSEESFKGVAEAVARGHDQFFVGCKGMRWISEPGRFMAAPTYTLHVPVIGRKPVWPAPQAPMDPKWRFTIDESVYGMFSNIPFDHQQPEIQSPPNRVGALRPAVLFGRTCDSGDLISDSIPLPEDLDVGDVLTVPNMGAYTSVTASEFNGFPKPSIKVIE
jgi:ornithine decarboxylase